MKYRSIPIILDVILQGIQVEMILDTGATASIIGLGRAYLGIDRQTSAEPN